MELAKAAPEEVLVLTDKVFGVLIDVKEELGELSTEEAIEELVAYGLTIQEAKDLLGGTDSVASALAALGDVYIDLGELERMEVQIQRNIDLLNLMRTAGIGVGVPGTSPGSPFDFPVPSQLPGPGPQPDTSPGGGGTVPPTGGGGSGQQQNFYFTLGDELDVEETIEQIARGVAEN